MSDNIQQVWEDAIAVTLQWFQESGLLSQEHYVENCCEDENIIREWAISD